MTDVELVKPLIHGKLMAIQEEIGAIKKDQRNDFHKFNYRGIDAVYNALHDKFKKHRVLTRCETIREYTETVEGEDKGKKVHAFNRVFVFRYHFIAEDGSEVWTEATGEGVDKLDKASNKAMSAAHKYALLQFFMIPTEDMEDSDRSTDAPIKKEPENKEATDKLRACKTTDELRRVWESLTPEARTSVNNVKTEMKAKLV